MASGIIDLQSATGDLRGTLTPNPFPSPDVASESVSIEAIDVKGVARQRALGAGQWRNVDGGLGSFLQLGNSEALFSDALNEVLQPVQSWAFVDAEPIGDVPTQHLTGVAEAPNRGAVDIWLDAKGVLRRIRLERGSLQSKTKATVVLELWDFGIAVVESLPT